MTFQNSTEISMELHSTDNISLLEVDYSEVEMCVLSKLMEGSLQNSHPSCMSVLYVEKFGPEQFSTLSQRIRLPIGMINMSQLSNHVIRTELATYFPVPNSTILKTSQMQFSNMNF